jgi:ribokinase
VTRRRRGSPTAPVLVIGSLNIDSLVRVTQLPRPGETALAQSVQLRPGGKGANQAAAAALLGAEAIMIGCIGADDGGREARTALRAAGVDESGVVVTDEPTGAATVVIADDGENLIIVSRGANAELTAGHVRAAVTAHPGAVVLLSLEIPLETATAAARIAAEAGCTVVLNAAPAQALPAELLGSCVVLVANEHEVGQLGADIPALVAGGPNAVVVTSGPRGADIYRAGGAVAHQPAFAVAVIDTSGAGDAFCGGLAWSLANGDGLDSAVRVAAAVGALATRGVGPRARLPGAGELIDFLRPPA